MLVDDVFRLMLAKTIVADVDKKIVWFDMDQKIPSRCRPKNLLDVDQKIISTDISNKTLADIDQQIALTDANQKNFR